MVRILGNTRDNRSMKTIPIAQNKDKGDANQASWGRQRHEGFSISKQKFLQPAPLFFTQDHHPLWLCDMYRGRSAFLIASGPSFAELDHGPLRQPGMITMGLNNSPRSFRPNLWTCVDSPDHWIRSIWLDPLIQKFVPTSMAPRRIFNSDSWEFMRTKVGDCPNVVYFKRNEHFQAKQYLWEDCINWGNHKDYGGGRSVLLAAVRILFSLGIRRIFLLGVDLDMSATRTYHFDQKRHPGSVSGNMDTYSKLNTWFKELRPIFEAEDFHVFNCNAKSKLTAFDYVRYDDALTFVHEEMDLVNYATERSRNLYDTETREKEEGVGKSLTWFRLNSPRGVKRCKFCGKKCARVASDTETPNMITLTMNCEQSRAKLWEKHRNKYRGSMDLVRTKPLPEAEAVAEWNARFGKVDK